MKFSMNGFRRQLHKDTAKLKELIEAVIAGDYSEADDLADAMNELITHSNVINCVFNPDDPDFTEMGDLELELVEVQA